MEPELTQRLAALEAKIDATFASVEKTRKYFLTSLAVTVLAFLLPVIGLIFAVPAFLSSYTSDIEMLTQ